MKYQVEDLIENYEQKVETLTRMIVDVKSNPRQVSVERLTTKRSVFRSVIVDLERVLKNSENAEQTSEKAHYPGLNGRTN
jgi:hypothetical protein